MARRRWDIAKLILSFGAMPSYNKDTVLYNVHTDSDLTRNFATEPYRDDHKRWVETKRPNSYNLIHRTCTKKYGEIIWLYDVDQRTLYEG